MEIEAWIPHILRLLVTIANTRSDDFNINLISTWIVIDAQSPVAVPILATICGGWWPRWCCDGNLLQQIALFSLHMIYLDGGRLPDYTSHEVQTGHSSHLNPTRMNRYL